MTTIDPISKALLETKLAQARRLVDLALDALTLKEIQALVAEIEMKLASNDNDAA